MSESSAEIGDTVRMQAMSRRTGVHERMLRYYEQRGLLRPRRRPSGYREFDESDVDTVLRIRTLLDAGLSTALIAEVLPCVDGDGTALHPTCDGVRARLDAERERLTRSIDALTTSRDLLDRVLGDRVLGDRAPDGPAR